MLQLQYFNTKLKNKHINNILDNYKLKYTGLKNELDTKINELIKLFVKDISNFLETTEEIANAKKKLNNYEKMKSELESIRNQLKLKIYNEHKIKNELEVLNQENSILKVKLNSLKQKLNNLSTYNINNNSNKTRSKSPFNSKTLRDSNLITPKINLNLRSSFNDYKKEISDFRKTYNKSVERKASGENSISINKLDLSLTSKFDYSSRVLEKVEKTNSKMKKNNNKKNIYSILKRSSIKKGPNPVLNNNNINNNNENSININNSTTIKKKKNIKKFLKNKEKEKISTINKSNNKLNTNTKYKITSFTPFTPYTSVLNSNLKKNISNIKEFKELNDTSQDNSADITQGINTEYEDFEKKINNAIDEELKQLEQDEEKIKKLLETINNGKSNEINSDNVNNTNNNSGESD